jgi:hypothetical protein
LNVVLFVYCFHSSLVKLLNGNPGETAGESTPSPQAGPVWMFLSPTAVKTPPRLNDSTMPLLNTFGCFSILALRPGDDWDLELAGALSQSSITVVLVSPSTGGSYYQREEIALAIKRARANPEVASRNSRPHQSQYGGR